MTSVRRTRTVVACAAVAVLAAGLAALGAEPAVSSATPQSDPMPVVAAGVPLIVGAGTPTPSPTLVHSVAGFTRTVPSSSRLLRASVRQFFVQGGRSAWVETLASPRPATLVRALDAVTGSGGDQDWDLLVVPDLTALAPAAWLTVAEAAVSAAAAHGSLALLDPPRSTVAAASRSGAGPLVRLARKLDGAVSDPDAAVLLSSGFTDRNNPVPGAAVLAGLLAATDAARGVWVDPGGQQPVAKPLVPQLVVGARMSRSLAGAGVDSWRALPGGGSTLIGDETLAGAAGTGTVAAEQTVEWLRQSVAAGLQQFVFAPNDGATWDAASTLIGNWLATLWQKGALVGASPASAGSVEIGVPSTMTAQDVLNGEMIVAVTVQVTGSGSPTSFQLDQTMA